MSALSDLKWSLVGVRPDKNGKCVTYIVDENGKKIAVSKKRETLEDAYAAAEQYASHQKRS
jgi:hypothetical protein